MAWDKKTWMGLFIAVIMILSVIGFSLSFAQPAEKLEYKEHKFVRTSQGLRTQLNGINVFFSWFPRDLEDIEVDEGSKAALEGTRVLWFTYDPDDENVGEVANSLYRMEEILAKVADIYVQRGLINNTGYQLPSITCLNATTTIPVLVLKSSNETKVSHENGCITAEGTGRNGVQQVSDRVLYQMLEVME